MAKVARTKKTSEVCKTLEVSNNTNGFQETEIGYIPQEWTVVQLESVVVDLLSGDWGEDNDSANEGLVGCRVIRGTDFPKVESGSFATVPVRYIKPNSVEKRQVKQDDFLVEISGGSRDQPTGRLWHATNVKLKTADAPVVFTNFVKLLRIDLSSVSSGFFRYAWDYLYAAGKTQIYEKRTTGIRNFKYRDFLANESIPLPPLPEQRAIAHILSTIQRAIAAQDAVIVAAREVKRSLMHRLFTYGPYANPLPTKETEIGEVPVAWNVAQLGELCEFLQYGTSERCNTDPSGIPVLRIPNVVDGRVDTSDLKFIKLPSATVKHLQLEVGDLLFVRTNGRREYTGRCAVFKGELPQALFASYLIRARVEREFLLSEFVQAYAETLQGKSFLSGRASNAADGKFNINTQTIRSVLVPLPSLDEQAKIVNALHTCDTKIATEERRKAALQALFKSMLHELMTGQVRVQTSEV